MLRTLKEWGSYTKRLKNEAAHICDDYGFYIKYHDNITKITHICDRISSATRLKTVSYAPHA